MFREHLEGYSFVCSVSLLGTDKSLDCNIIPGADRPPKRDRYGNIAPTRDFLQTLVGERTCAGTILIDPEDNLPKIFFVFTDLSPRVSGDFRLKCDIIDMFK
jgi:hypothetical protein